MEDYSKYAHILKETRCKYGLTIDEIAKHTKIAKKYIRAIEENKFSIFPSRLYVKGYIDIYAQALGLQRLISNTSNKNTTTRIKINKEYKHQEHETFLERHFPKFRWVVLSVVAMAFIYFLISIQSNSDFFFITMH